MGSARHQFPTRKDPCTGAWVNQDLLPFTMQVAYAASVGPVITAVSTASGAFVGAFSTVT